MKLKALVLIGSLIAFSSCEKEDVDNVNELNRDSRLIGRWHARDVDAGTGYEENFYSIFSSDGEFRQEDMYTNGSGDTLTATLRVGDWRTSNTMNNPPDGLVSFEHDSGKIIYEYRFSHQEDSVSFQYLSGYYTYLSNNFFYGAAYTWGKE